MEGFKLTEEQEKLQKGLVKVITLLRNPRNKPSRPSGENIQ